MLSKGFRGFLCPVSLFYGKKPTFWDYLSVPFSGSRRNPSEDFPFDYLETLNMGQASSPKTLVSYRKITTPGKNPKAFTEKLE
jgi:hypothetical protein